MTARNMDAPSGVNDSALLLGLIAGYCAVMMPPLLLVGMFVGSEILLGSLAHALIGTLAFLARLSLLRKRCWAWWMALILHVVLLLVGAYTCIIMVIHRVEFAGVMFSTILVMLSGAGVATLMRQDVRIWIRRPQ